MILLLGATGYIGSAFQKSMEILEIPFLPISRHRADYTARDTLVSLIKSTGATFIINAAGHTGKPNVDACERQRSECLAGNAVLPGTIRYASELTGVPWGHVSSGCIYQGRRPDGNGFSETDTPNFSFRTNNCSFYSGCKALGEECLIGAENTYLWRLRIPFNHESTPRNYLTKVMSYERLLDAENSISHLDEFVDACLQCWAKRVPFGTYNITNTGSITTKRVTELISAHLLPEKKYDFFKNEEEFMKIAAITPRSNCVMDTKKILDVGIKLSDVEDAIIKSLNKWTAT